MVNKLFWGVLFLGLGVAPAGSPLDFDFDGPLTRHQLESYLSRSMTMLGLLNGQGDLQDHIRLLTNTGAKFAGRAVYCWGGESVLPQLLKTARKNARHIHEADPQMVLQGAVFEIVTRQVDQLPIPPRVFAAFEIEPEQRNFRYQQMFSEWGRDHWNRDASVPDISLPETKLWFFWLATAYIDIGCEAIHFGQVDLMARNDPQRHHWDELLQKVRAHAAQHARRHWVLCDGHVPSWGMVVDGRLLLDFHSFPLRIAEVPDQPHEGELRMGYLDTIYGRSRGGRSPSGWECEHLPYLVELDNYGKTDTPGQASGDYWTWGWDEIDWFAHQPADYRNAWLQYAWSWVRDHDPAGYLQMPGMRCLHDPPADRSYYYAHRPSDRTPEGFGQEETIKLIWQADAVARQATP